MIVKRDDENGGGYYWVRAYIDEKFAHVDTKIEAVNDQLEQRANFAEKALDVAKSGLNEMRSMAMDQQANFVFKAEFGAEHAALIARLEAYMLETNRRLEEHNKSIITIQGQSKGFDKSWSIIVAVASMAIAIASIIWANFRIGAQ